MKLYDPYAEFQTIILDNGLTVYAAQKKRCAVQRMHFLVHSGGRDFLPYGQGIAHFVEHLVSSNTILSDTDMYDMFNRTGGNVNLGVTNYFATKYAFLAPANRTFLKKALEVFGHMLLLAELKNGVENHRKIILNEFEQSHSIAFQRELQLKKSQLLYPSGHVLSTYIDPLGELESIQNLTQVEMQEFYNYNYVPANISIVSYGGLPVQAVIDLIQQSHFGIKKPGVRNMLPKKTSETPYVAGGRNEFMLTDFVQFKHMQNRDNGGFSLETLLPGTLSKNAVNFFEDILKKRFNDELREKRQWTYSVSFDRNDWGDVTSFAFGCNLLNQTFLQEAEDLAFQSLESMVHEKEAFLKFKDENIKSIRFHDPNLAMVCKNIVSDIEQQHSFTTLADDIQEIEKVTFEDICFIANMYVRERTLVSVRRL